MRIPTRIPYMRGARYLGYGRAHKLRPAAGLERCATNQHTVQLVFGEQLADVFQIDRAAVEDHEGRGGDGVVGQPSANRPVDFGGVLWRRIASGTDRPDGLVGDGDPRLAVAFPERRLELPRDDLQRVARLTLLEGLADAEDRLQVRGERGGDLLARRFVRFTKDMTPFRVADERQSCSGLFGERAGDGAGEGAFGLPVDVLRSHQNVAVTGDGLRYRFDRQRGREEPDRAFVRHFPGRKECAQVLARFAGTHVHLPVARKDEWSHASSSAATPGSSFPSRNSSDAPPPVDTWL